MQIGELVSCICAFPNVSSKCAFGCESGKFGIFDCETSQIIYSNDQLSNDKINSIVVEKSSELVYGINSHSIFMFDSRIDPMKPTFCEEFEYEIFDIAAQKSSVAVLSQYNSITTFDNRFLQIKNNENQNKTANPSVIRFINDEELICGYEDSSVIKWNYFNEEYKTFQIPTMLKNRKLKPLSILSFNDGNHFLIGYESGFSIYENNENKNVEHKTFEQKGIFQRSEVAPCLSDRSFISIVDQNSLLHIKLDENYDSELIQSKEFHGSLLTSLTANHLFICAIEDDDDGIITILLPEIFLNE